MFSLIVEMVWLISMRLNQWGLFLEEESMILCPKDIVDIIGGLPLAIEVIASYLYGSKVQIQIWREALDRWGRKLENEVEKTFKVIYGSLDEKTRQILLDLVCFSLDG